MAARKSRATGRRAAAPAAPTLDINETRDTVAQLDAPAAPAAPADPGADVGDIIGQAVGDTPAAADDALRALDALAPLQSHDPAPGDGEGTPGSSGRKPRDYAAEHARRVGKLPPGRPGRPRSDAPALSAPVEGDPDVKPGSKLALARELDEVRRENERLRAQSDTAAVDRLAQSFEVLATLLFSIPAPSRGPHWPLTPAEAENIGEAFGHAAAPYADKIEAELPWVAPVIAIGAALGSRLMVDAQLKKQREGLA